MKSNKGFDVAWACDHGQYALDENDRDILPHLIGWHPCPPPFSDVDCGFFYREVISFVHEFWILRTSLSTFSNSIS